MRETEIKKRELRRTSLSSRFFDRGNPYPKNVFQLAHTRAMRPMTTEKM